MWRQASSPAVGRHLAARKYRLHGGTPGIYRGSSGGDAAPPGWKPRLYVSQDGLADDHRGNGFEKRPREIRPACHVSASFYVAPPPLPPPINASLGG